MKQILIFFVIWLGLVTIGLAMGFGIFRPGQFDRFTDRGVPAYGIVTAKEPENHALLRYRYSVGGVEYTGAGGARRGNPDFASIKIGDQIIIYYDSENPQDSITGYPEQYSSIYYSAPWLVAVIFPIIPMFLIVTIYFIVRKAITSS